MKTGRGILNVSAAAQALNLPAPTDMDDLLQNGRGGLLTNLVRAAANGPASLYMREETVAHAPVVTRPEKIIMMGFNYRTHAQETGTTPPKDPPLFNKYNNTLNYHGGTIKLPTAVAKNFDYEVELVIVFGRECRNVSEADALNYVAGYCTGNDFSARDLQMLTSQFMIGKTHDGFAPLGPYMVTSDLIPDPNNLQARDAGERRDAAGLEHQRHDLQLPPAHQLCLEDDDHQAGRHLLHRHPAGCDPWYAAGQARLAEGGRQGRLQPGKARRAALRAHLSPVRQRSAKQAIGPNK